MSKIAENKLEKATENWLREQPFTSLSVFVDPPDKNGIVNGKV